MLTRVSDGGRPERGPIARGVQIALALLIGFSAPLGGQAAPGPSNPDFESGPVGGVPTGWFLAGTARVGTALLTIEDRRRGRQSVVLSRNKPEGNPTNLMQQFDAASFVGRRVRYRLAVRTDSPSAIAQMWMRIDGAAAPGAPAPVAFLDNMAERPIVGQSWTYYDVVADVPAGATRIALGLFLTGTGRAWADDGSFEVLGTSPARVVEGPRPLTARGLANLVTFSKLVGYVRHFHPSDEAATADWETFTIAGMRAVESSPDAQALARTLETLFRPIAPSMQIRAGNDLAALPPVPPPAGRLLAWHHSGYGQTRGSIYRSERRGVESPLPPVDVRVGGVLARIPLTVGSDNTGTLPRAPRAATQGMPAPTRSSATAVDRATRLAAIALTWNVFEHFYPYFDVVNTDWSSILEPALGQAAIDENGRDFGMTLRHLIAGLRDGHAVVASPGDSMSVPPVSLGWFEERLIVLDAAPSTGLERGDLVISIDGTPAPLALEDRERAISGATAQWIRYRALQELLSGASGSGVRIRVDRWKAPGTREDVELVRSVPGMFTPPSTRERISDLQPGIVYADLTRLNDGDLKAAIPKLVTARGVIFDLRGYPGGFSPETLFSHLSDMPLTSAQWHVPEIVLPDRRELRFTRAGEWNIAPAAPRLSGKIVFLTDGRAISYAESCMGIVEHYRLGEIVGSTTAGTNGNINRFDVPGGYTIVFTGMKVLKHDGSVHHGVGIRPTIPVSPTRAGIAAGRDEVLERALQTLSGL
jgi:C-terminal processing protease CtpA/Prc